MEREGVVIENVAVKRRVDTALTSENIITYTAVSIFLPYVLSAIVLGVLAIYVIANKRMRQLIFVHNGTGVLKAFFIYVLAIPFLYGNWKGLMVGAAMVLALILGLYLRSIMTKERYENTLHLICGMSLTSSGYALFEAFINFLNNDGRNHRIAAVFSHPNYFGTIAATVIIICAYKILTKRDNKWFYCFVAVANVVSMYLCKSMFAFIEVFIGIAVLLVVLKRYRLLTLWLSVAVLGAILIFIFSVDLIPRLADVSVTIRIRQQIWKLALQQIKQEPLFGHGFLSFSYIYNTAYQNRQIPHAHSIYLDMILNFGVVGSILMIWYFVRYYISVIVSCFKRKKTMVAALIFAVTAAALVHGATDLTMLWIQTLPLLLLIMAGQGIEEKVYEFQHWYGYLATNNRN